MTYIGTKPKQKECPYLNQAEDKLKTTFSPLVLVGDNFVMILKDIAQ